MADTLPVTALLMNGERLFSFSTIAQNLPGYRENTHANAATVYRWATKGIRAASGAVIKLEAVRLGAAWKTSLEAVARFSAKLTAATLPPDATPSAPPSPTPKQHASAAAKASREADQIFGTAKAGE